MFDKNTLNTGMVNGEYYSLPEFNGNQIALLSTFNLISHVYVMQFYGTNKLGIGFLNEGLDVGKLLESKEQGGKVSDYPDGPGVTKGDAESIIDVPCDIWIPAARPDEARHLVAVEKVRVQETVGVGGSATGEGKIHFFQ